MKREMMKMLAVAGAFMSASAFAADATTSTATAPAAKTLKDYMGIKYSGEFTGPGLGNLGAGTVPDFAGAGAADSVNLYSSIGISAKLGDYRLTVAPRFQYNTGVVGGDRFNWLNLRASASKNNVLSAGNFSIKTVALMTEFGTTAATRAKSQLGAIRGTMVSELKLGAGSRFSLGHFGFFQPAVYDGNQKAEASAMSAYSNTSLNYQASDTVSISVQYENSGSTIGKNIALWSQGDPDLKNVVYIDTFGGKLNLGPYVMIQNGTIDSTVVGMEIVGTVL
jgi:hypothetical protein